MRSLQGRVTSASARPARRRREAFTEHGGHYLRLVRRAAELSPAKGEVHRTQVRTDY